MFPLYFELGRNPVQAWDEARLAVNAAEMARDGHWLVPQFNGVPDHWNTKPPLLICLEALSLRAFGFSTWALRLPTLLATLATVGLLFQFAARVLKRPLAGFLGVLVLVTCAGFVRLHVARTADYDALLTCWQVLLWTRFFQYLETGARRHLVWAAVALLAATLTKGPAGLLGLPGLLAYAIGRGKLGWLLRQPGVYVAATGFIVLIVSYLEWREHIDPGYWWAVQSNDLGGRFFTPLKGSSYAGWPYYLENIKNRSFFQWLWALAPALLLAWMPPAGLVRRAAGLLVAFVGGWLLVITLAASKYAWYDAPIYPALALLVGLGLSLLWQDLLGLYLPRLGRAGGWGLRLVLFVTLFYGGYRTTLRQLVGERDGKALADPRERLAYYLTTVMRARPRLAAITLLAPDSNYPVYQYYKLEFEHRPGHQLALQPGTAAGQLPAGTVVVVCDPAYQAALRAAFTVVVVHQDVPCQTLLLRPRSH